MSFEQVKKFKEKINAGPVLGIFSKTSDPAIIETAGIAEFDFIIVDMEHGPNNILSAQNLVRAAEVSGIFPIARIKEDDFSMIGQAFDIGFGGVQVPKIKEAEDIKRVVSVSKFFPEGNRGVCRFVRSAGYSGIEKNFYFQESNNNVLILQLEGIDAIRNLEQILDSDGFDIIFVGPYDLSQSLGVTGDTKNPLVDEAIKNLVEKCNKKQKVTGIFTDTLNEIPRWIKLGVKYIAYSVDVGIFYEASRKIVENFKSCLKETKIEK